MGKKSKERDQEREEAERNVIGVEHTNGAAAAAEGVTREGNKVLASDWKRAEIAYNDEGNIIILDPRVASRVRMAARADREIEIGIPAGAVEFVPNPLEGARTGAGKIRLNELCVCDYLRFHLVTEAPVLHKLLSTMPRHEV